MSKYHDYAHAMQSGVAMEMGYDDSSVTPKHLRVGINSAMVNDEAIAQLLMDKGIITKDEYEEAITAAMKREKERYEKRLTERFGRKISLA